MNYTPIDRNVAKKYAKAFMAVFPKACTFADIGKITKAQQFLRKHKQTLLFLQLPQFDQKRKKSMVLDLIGYFSLPHELSSLILLLLSHNRSFDIPEVLSCITELYLEQNNSIEFSLKSTQHLNDKQVETIKNFIRKSLNKNIIAIQAVDPSLIAGLRLQSKDYLWEYSVRKHIKSLQKLEQ